MNLSPGAPRYLFIALYGAAALVFIDQAAELLVAMYPFNFDNLHWRFGAFGLLVGRTTTAILVDAMFLLAALGLRHAGVLRVWGLLHLVGAAILLGGGAVFALDVLELKNVVSAEGLPVVYASAGRAGLVALATVIYCIWIAIATMRSTRRGTMTRGADEPEPLLVTG